jgi:hypothetical protein
MAAIWDDALMVEAVRTSETSVYIHETVRHYIPEICHFHTCSRKNLKSDTDNFIL